MTSDFVVGVFFLFLFFVEAEWDFAFFVLLFSYCLGGVGACVLEFPIFGLVSLLLL
jgi:hypothetical protein